ncbi:MAG TPA: tRNA preQ1(34) S-adenosylmethionine ribosyltransferase-isomerase QueA [Blastocatellia bacterium]|nr:tRNA preQ1(34) S-adenosylmethionine ribosyltransferase-isomerase QueA [Blastocatellia bacterium]
MRVSDFDFALPDELIAQRPAEVRDASRLLTLDRSSGAIADGAFTDISSALRPGDLLVVNDTRVFPARLIGRREPSGGRVELFPVADRGSGVWDVLARPAARLRPGDTVVAGEGPDALRAVVESVEASGRRIVRFDEPSSLWERLDRWGRTPLPPYIHRVESSDDARLDAERYQTVFARARGAIAAPTAGLHFTNELLRRLEDAGVARASVTLHVGYGTFQPVRVERVEDHRVEPESYEIPAETVEAVARTRAAGGRVVAVGTTTTRALESAAEPSGALRVGPGTADVFIYPGYTFRAIDALVTNFHLPKSSLLMLVAAFAGRERVLEAYRHAVENRYRFYSYGDAMLIV